jgi:hypothetical protein
MANPLPAEQQAEPAKAIWKRYRVWDKTAVHEQGSQGFFRRHSLRLAAFAMVLAPFAKTLDKYGLPEAASGLATLAAIVFAFVAWLNKEFLSDDSQQPWVRARETAEGLKALTFRFLAGVPPFDTPAAAQTALDKAAAIVANVSNVDLQEVDAVEAEKELPPVPLTPDQYVKVRLEDQIDYYAKARRIALASANRARDWGRVLSGLVVVFGVVSAATSGGEKWLLDIWVPAMGLVGTMIATESARSRKRFLAESYGAMEERLSLIKASPRKTPADDDALALVTETMFAAERTAWVQQMLAKPLLPDQGAKPPEGT